ncbi:hypothetical protein SGR_7061t [Streptomyces griseus subsp. griseus NBRC 13350]|uniref:Uncharacterized protein n=1 Tax=Streptomyces griseus subsp. griseus (strain JCM 4626 / CBS 651.72 / NBRC 13350 / KCC S-0626 / ISP 5235) TaxID=455632 RepID=B1VM06_STRGG|nr:hypothetical protein SGR_78t [Streptomyces griseus subsp. griseus NBRC 13350]BAG23888.1 hypothetical protein SGR_7061t [Streptomyces griseus subsp. griseus NBRC 13350]
MRYKAPGDRFPFSDRSFPALWQIFGGQGEAAAHEVDLDDPYGDLVALAHDLAGVVDGLVTVGSTSPSCPAVSASWARSSPGLIDAPPVYSSGFPPRHTGLAATADPPAVSSAS